MDSFQISILLFSLAVIVMTGVYFLFLRGGSNEGKEEEKDKEKEKEEEKEEEEE